MITSEEKTVLADLVDIIGSLKLPMILVGAGARILIFDQKFGEGRGTKDWDIAISIDSWDSYRNLCAALTTGDSPRFNPTKVPHKLIHTETNIEVDIVPFGNIGEPNQEITWPDSGKIMKVVGFTEALLSAKTTIIDDLEIQVVDTPAFIVLKIFAWDDRRDLTNKDIEDINFILSKYDDDDRVYDEDDRFFDELVNKLADGTVELLYASIYLLGKDISEILQENTRVKLDILLEKLMNHHDARKVDFLSDRLKVLQAGIRSLEA
jgi:predicted nucleotidyltransferase